MSQARIHDIAFSDRGRGETFVGIFVAPIKNTGVPLVFTSPRRRPLRGRVDGVPLLSKKLCQFSQHILNNNKHVSSTSFDTGNTFVVILMIGETF